MSKIHIIYIKGKIYTVREKEKEPKSSNRQKKIHANFKIENTDTYQPKL